VKGFAAQLRLRADDVSVRAYVDDLAAEANKEIETCQDPSTIFTGTLDADFHAVNAQHNSEFYSGPMFVLDYCAWIFGTQQFIDSPDGLAFTNVSSAL